MRAIQAIRATALAAGLAGASAVAAPAPADVLFCSEAERACRLLPEEAAAPFVRAVRTVEAELPAALRALLELDAGTRRLPGSWSFAGAMVLADAAERPAYMLAGWVEADALAEVRIAALFTLFRERDGRFRPRLIATFPRGPDDMPRWPSRIDAAALYGAKGPAILHLRLDSGGAETLLAVADHLVEFAPWPRITDLGRLGYVMGTLHDLDDRPPPELVFLDARWAQYYDDRLDAGPWVPMVSTVEDGRLVPACDRHPDLYRRRLDELEAEIRRGLADPASILEEATASDPLPPSLPFRARAVVAERITERLLTALQVGWIAEAEADRRRLETFLGNGIAGERALVARIRADLQPVMEAARTRAPCRLHGVEVGDVTSRVLYAEIPPAPAGPSPAPGSGDP